MGNRSVGSNSIHHELTLRRSVLGNDNFKTTSQANQSIAFTNWPLFTVGLVQRGYKDEEIRKIIGGNVMRVAREAPKV